MYTYFLLLSVSLFLALPALYVNSTEVKVQRTDSKDLYKKPKELKKQDYIRYQDWDLDWSNEDMMQHPIDEAPRRAHRGLGEICSYSRDCSSGCCLMDRETKIRSCQPKALRGQNCTAAQVKADLYVDACPCYAGMDFCSFPDNVCKK